MAPFDDDILIAGAGPTGLSAATFLMQAGIRPRIIDQAPSPSGVSKALAVNARSLQLFESSGVTDRLLRAGRRLTRGCGWIGHRKVSDVDLSKAQSDCPFLNILSQAETERILADHLESQGVAVEWGRRLTRFDVQEDGSLLCTIEGGTACETVRVRTLLGADGVNSTVRKLAGIDFPGSHFDEEWRLYDIHASIPLDPDAGHEFLFDDGGMVAIYIGEGVWRIAGAATNLLDRLPSGSQLGEVVWDSTFTFSHRVAERFSVGPVYLAGDAAHVQSAVGGRGMNLGIEDAYVFTRLLADGRLHEYEGQRRPTARKLVRQVEFLTEIVRNRRWYARMARLAGPIAAPIVSLSSGVVRRWILGVDNPLEKI